MLATTDLLGLRKDCCFTISMYTIPASSSLVYDVFSIPNIQNQEKLVYKCWKMVLNGEPPAPKVPI